VALIKPQFEAGKAEADRGSGVIRIRRFIRACFMNWRICCKQSTALKQVTESPLLGPAGNKEFLALIEKS
jgi:23S rRNA (cytidine1920-2'-O)/16S rRNA (cytidine1409-2'-O)-methyltransferase